MSGIKLQQLKRAMVSILDEMNDHDRVDVVEFSHKMDILDINTQSRITVKIDNFKNPFRELIVSIKIENFFL